MFICLFIVVLLLRNLVNTFGDENKDRLKLFYDRIQQQDVKYCPDKTKLLPGCTECIPGLMKGPGSEACNEYIPSSKAIRDEIKKLTTERFGKNPVADRPFGLYPYLEKPDFMTRQLTFGKMLSTKSITNLVDIGSYYNPIHLFLAPDICPVTVMVIEPILDALSVSIPCIENNADKFTHVLFLPITFKHYTAIRSTLPMPETIVCIGCDSHYGPSRKMLETSFTRPYSLYIEYPSEYVHNKPFRLMNGEGKGEEMTFIDKFQPHTNETIYIKRVMKVIEYK